MIRATFGAKLSLVGCDFPEDLRLIVTPHFGIIAVWNLSLLATTRRCHSMPIRSIASSAVGCLST